jgi:2-haloacid dehalogenase
MPATLAFDVYGTLIDTHGVVESLRERIGDLAPVFSQSWRERQLEYSFRRGLMQHYVDFAVCTRQALDHTCALHGVALGTEDKAALLGSYRSLPPFADVADGLARLQADGHRLFAFSNGRADAVEELLAHAGLRAHFLDVVSVDDLKTFKPSPAVYAHFLRRAGATVGDAWLVSSNPFDVIGAVSAGLYAAWVRRSPAAIFDPWDIAPTLTVGGIGELGERIAAFTTAHDM